MVAQRCSTDNPRTLFQCSKWWTRATSRMEGSPEGGSGTGKAAWAEKPVRKRSFDTTRATSNFLEGGLHKFQLPFMSYRKLRQICASDHRPQKGNSGYWVCSIIFLRRLQQKKAFHSWLVVQTRSARCLHEKWSSDENPCRQIT